MNSQFFGELVLRLRSIRQIPLWCEANKVLPNRARTIFGRHLLAKALQCCLHFRFLSTPDQVLSYIDRARVTLEHRVQSLIHVDVWSLLIPVNKQTVPLVWTVNTASLLAAIR